MHHEHVIQARDRIHPAHQRSGCQSYPDTAAVLAGRQLLVSERLKTKK